MRRAAALTLCRKCAKVFLAFPDARSLRDGDLGAGSQVLGCTDVTAMSSIKSPRQTSSSGDRAKIRKLADMAAALQDGSQNYFYITRLISIKSLCRTGDVAMRFALYLAERTLARMQAAKPPLDAANLSNRQGRRQAFISGEGL